MDAVTGIGIMLMVPFFIDDGVRDDAFHLLPEGLRFLPVNHAYPACFHHGNHEEQGGDDNPFACPVEFHSGKNRG